MRLVVLPYFCDKKKQKQSGNGLEISCVYTMKGRKYMLVRIEYMIKGQFGANETTKMLNIFHISKKCVCFVNLLKTHDPCLLTGLRAHAKYKIFHKIKFQIFTKYFSYKVNTATSIKVLHVYRHCSSDFIVDFDTYLPKFIWLFL